MFNIRTIKTGLGNWLPSCDHSKWCVARKNHWVCIADVNRAATQFNRYGGALCMNNEAIKKAFKSYVTGTEDCPTSNIMDISDTDQNDPSLMC